VKANVRRLGPIDAAAASRLSIAFHKGPVSEAYLGKLLADPANLLLVAEVADEPVGFAWAHWLARLGQERQQLFLYEVEVDGRHRRGGVGSALMQVLLREASMRESDLFVFSTHSNAAAVLFYKSLGGQVKNGDDLLLVYPYNRDT